VSIPWDRLLAERTAWIRPSLLVDFERLPSSADLILFSGGAPPLECLPVERIAGALAEAWHAEPEALWYGESQGHEPLRVLIAERMRQRGAAVEPDEVIITNGSQQGIDLIARLLLEPGDRVIVEAPTYFGALQVFEPFDARISTVPVDEHGMVIEALERELASAPRPKLIYTVPTFQNPTGVTLDPERRAALVALAERYGVPIVEDDPYGELWFDRPPPPPLRALHPDVLYLGTFSKTLAPGLRIGWLVAPRRLMKLLVDAKEGADIQVDRLLQRALARVLEAPGSSGTWRRRARTTGSAARSCCAAWSGSWPAWRPGPRRAVGSSSGSRCRTASIPTRCWSSARGMELPTSPARPFTPTAHHGRASGWASPRSRPRSWRRALPGLGGPSAPPSSPPSPDRGVRPIML